MTKMVWSQGGRIKWRLLYLISVAAGNMDAVMTRFIIFVPTIKKVKNSRPIFFANF